MWKLVIEDDEGKRTVVPLTRDDYTIGRKEGNTIRLTERNVSRVHDKLRKNGAGPTPGAEFPLDRERLTIGRAEDADISVNHNSVSRLHCEVHALGEGRFEIVDKGSSNGVRVNSADLRRGIIEAGDVIELGDVK